MKDKSLMLIREFSRLTGIKSENLRFYDKIGLLSPEVRGDNDYRYYSRRQLNSAYLILTLRELGVGIEEIQEYSKERTPDKMLTLITQQDERIRNEIKRLEKLRELMKFHADMATDALIRGNCNFLLTKKEREPIFLCPTLSPEMDVDEGSLLSYDYAAKHNIHLGHPLGAIISKEQFEMGDSSIIFRYFFKVNKGYNAWKPAGLYAVAYGQCDPWHSKEVYCNLLAFIKEQGLTPCDDVYEQSPINEMAVQNANEFVIRIEVPVKKI